MVRPLTAMLCSLAVLFTAAACGKSDDSPPDDLATTPDNDVGDDSSARPDGGSVTSPALGGEGGVDAIAAPFRVMTYNIKHGEVGGLDAVGAAILAEKPDIVGLQEVDVDATRSGNVDQPHRLGQLTGMTDLFRTALTLAAGGSYGVALLSRYPILASERLALTSSGEQRICAVVDVLYDKARDLHLTIAIAHLDLDAASRTIQANEIVAALTGKKNVVLMGDFNAKPDEASIAKFGTVLRDGWSLAGEGDGFTIPVAAPARRIDYIFFGPEWRAPVAARVPTTQASDHLPVIVDVPHP